MNSTIIYNIDSSFETISFFLSIFFCSFFHVLNSYNRSIILSFDVCVHMNRTFQFNGSIDDLYLNVVNFQGHVGLIRRHLRSRCDLVFVAIVYHVLVLSCPII